jgi:hypothetical protein
MYFLELSFVKEEGRENEFVVVVAQERMKDSVKIAIVLILVNLMEYVSIVDCNKSNRDR